jgi:hypothetical protein
LESRGNVTLRPRRKELQTDGRNAEQVEHDPAVATVVSQQVEIAIGDERLAALARLHDIRPRIPHPLRERVVEMHTGDGLHDAAVAHPESLAVYGFHPADIGFAELRDRNAGVAIDDRGHRCRPQKLVTQMLIDELMQIEKVLQQLPTGRESRRDELDQRFRVVGSDVFVGERGTQHRRMRGLRDVPVRSHAQRLLFNSPAPALE